MVLKISEQIFNLFVNREDCYAEQFLQKNEKKGFRCIKKPITLDLIEKHLEGKDYLGVYQLSKDSKVKWGCLDFDVNTIEDFNNAKKIYEYAKTKGYYPLFEKSGGGDYKAHIWFFSEDLIPAKDMRIFLENLCEETRLKPHEIFPKQDTISEGEYGNLVKLPLGEHLQTRKYSVICGKNFKELSKEDILEKLRIQSEYKTEITSIKSIKENKEDVHPVLSGTKDTEQPHIYDNFMKVVLNTELPEGISKEVKIGNKEGGINNNLLKNMARWCFEKGYDLERLQTELKPIFDKNNWTFSDLKGWFKKCNKGDITEISGGELRKYAENYYPTLLNLIPLKETSTPILTQELEIRSISDYRKLKKRKDFIIEGFLSPETTTMIHSPPAHFKSLVALDMAFAISTGKEFMGLKTKKQSVLYCDGENSDLIVKERIINFHKGRRLKRWKIPLNFLTKGIIIDEKKNVQINFITALEKVIKQKNVKVLIFDTMHRFAYYDENKADDLNLLYTKVFRHLIAKYKISVVFLHHAKKDGGYRGSGDFLGMVDVSYKVVREGKTDRFRIINEKCRNGEIADILGEIDFGEEYIKVNRLSEEKDSEEKINALKELTDKVRGIFDIGTELSKKDIEANLQINEVEFASRTLSRVLKFLKENDYLDNSQKGVYRRIR